MPIVSEAEPSVAVPVEPESTVSVRVTNALSAEEAELLKAVFGESSPDFVAEIDSVTPEYSPASLSPTSAASNSPAALRDDVVFSIEKPDSDLTDDMSGRRDESYRRYKRERSRSNSSK